MGSQPADDREALAEALEEARAGLRASCAGLSDEQMARAGVAGDWSVKDVLSHVTSWEEVLLPDLVRIARGDAPVLASMNLETANFDPFNLMIMSLRRRLPLGQVMRELDISHAQVMEALHRLPEASLAEGQFARFLMEITAAHDREHGESIRRWREKEGL